MYTRDLERDDLFKKKFNGAFGIYVGEDNGSTVDPFVMIGKCDSVKILVFNSGLFDYIDEDIDNDDWEEALKKLILFDPAYCDIHCFNDVIEFIENYSEYHEDGIVDLLGKIVSIDSF